MNFEKVDRILSILASLGVLVGMGFLVIEISQNTQAIETEVTWARTSVMVELNTQLSQNDDMSDIVAKFAQMSASEIQQAMQTDLPDWISYSTYWGARRTYWGAVYKTQTSQEQRAALKNIIENALVFPGRRFALENLGRDSLEPDFLVFFEDIVDPEKQGS